ncbi:MAG: hypothetical protein OXN21_06905 [Chloroflexota bacterium]|nr:hypothetical protein [Chloroflexota bacterium]
MEILDDLDMPEWEKVQVRDGTPNSTLPEGPRIAANRFPTHYEVFRKLEFALVLAALVSHSCPRCHISTGVRPIRGLLFIL